MLVSRWARLCAAVLLFSSPLAAATYSVGPGQPLNSVGAVPWATLQPGDVVEIHWRAEPYREKWVLNRRGTAGAPIRVVGVPSANGDRPVIDGRDAVTAPGLNYTNEQRGVLKIGSSNVPADGLPAHLVIEGLEIRSGRPPYSFTDDNGQSASYVDNAASIYIEKGEHIILRNCVLHDSGNGLFIGAFDGQTKDILIEGNWLHSNGAVGRFLEHNAYTEALGITYQYNRFSALRPGADGNNLKDRSAGLVVRYNWIEDGNRQLDLVDAGTSTLYDDPSYRQTFVYGNVLIEGDGEGNSQIVHYGGDSGNTARYRKGTLYFFHNTVVSERSGNTTLLRLPTNDETADVRNNVLYVEQPGSRLAMLNAAGVLDLVRNWTKPGWRDSHSTLTGTVNDAGNGITSASPLFVDEAGQDYRLSIASPARDAAVPLHASALPDHALLAEYVRHQSAAERAAFGPADLGAFETCGSSGCGAIFEDGFEAGDLSAW
ncbi:MAG: polysaccharide-degrading enzyme [Acidobacteriota bacterium]